MIFKNKPNHLYSLYISLFIILAAALTGLGWAGSVEARIARQTNYGAYPEDERMKQDRADFQKATQGEHRLARMERLAHDYAYGQGADQNWNNQKLRRRMNVDQFDIVETIMDDKDGTAAMVVHDRISNRNVIVFRGTDGLLNGLTDPNPDAATDAAETAYAQIGQTQYAKHAKLFNKWAEKYSKQGKLDVVGHSLGGGLAHIFTAVHGRKINSTTTFQAPAQEGWTLKRFQEIPPQERPEVTLVVAAPDPVAHVGSEHAGLTKVIVASATDMTIGHGNNVLQNKDLTRWTDQRYRTEGDGLQIRELSPDEYKNLRNPNILKSGETWNQWRIKVQRMRNSELRRTVLRDGVAPNPEEEKERRAKKEKKKDGREKAGPAPKPEPKPTPGAAPLTASVAVHPSESDPGEMIEVVVRVSGGKGHYDIAGVSGVQWETAKRTAKYFVAAPKKPGNYSVTVTVVDSSDPPQKITKTGVFKVIKPAPPQAPAGRPALQATFDLSSVQVMVVYSKSRQSDAAMVIDYLKRSKVKKIRTRERSDKVKGVSQHKGKIYSHRIFANKAHLIAKEIAPVVKTAWAPFSQNVKAPNNQLVIWIVD